MLIAQISDLHLTRDEKFLAGMLNPYAALEQALENILHLTPRPDLLLITGDLAEQGELESYSHLSAQLKRLPFPYFITPGNHDNPEHLRTVFGQNIPVKQKEYFSYVIEDFPVRLIALDTRLENRARGGLSPSQIEWFIQTLANAPPDTPTLVFMHHPPFMTGINRMDQYGMVEGVDEFAEILKNNPQICSVLCGHIHRSVQSVIHGVPICGCPSISHQIALDLRQTGNLAIVMEPPAMMLHYWQPKQGLVSHLNYIQQYPGPYILD